MLKNYQKTSARHDSVEGNGSAEQTAIPQTDNSINQRVNDEDPNASNSTRSNVIIAGDSMVKHLDGLKMSKTDTRVKVSTFSGMHNPEYGRLDQANSS